jgi:recombination associated protein RdgC
MFKNLILYRYTTKFADIEKELKAAAFRPCEATQNESSGWVPPRGEDHGAYCESIASNWILRYQVEQKILPSAVVRLAASERAKNIEAASGRKLSNGAMRDLREQIYLELLPRAFTKRSASYVWLQPSTGLLAVEASSAKKADEIVVKLLATLDDITATPVSVARATALSMATWLLDFQAPDGFDLDRECELKAVDETQAAVRYTRHNIEIDEVKRHVQNGKVPKKVALTWKGRVAFTLTDTLQLKKIKLLEGEDHFDGDVAITCGELGAMIPELLEALGGETKR